MTKNEAWETIAEITQDVIRHRGDITADRVRIWGKAYTHWKTSCDVLTAAEVDDAIYDGRRKVADETNDD